MIMKVLNKRDNIHIDNVNEAMDRLVKDGFKDILVQPTHIINGEEYDKMIEQIEPFVTSFDTISIGKALLSTSEDYDEVCKAIMSEVPELDVTKNEAS